jgi:hypothetical protein
LIFTRVPENQGDRRSTQLFNQANALDAKANDNSSRAAFLRDSAETVKKKYRQAILIEADALDAKAGDLRTEAQAVRDAGTAAQNQENEILAVVPDNTINNDLDATTKKAVSESDEYENYIDNKNAGDAEMKKADDLQTEIDALENKKTKRIRSAIVSYDGTDEATTAMNNDAEVKALQDEINALKKKQEEYKNAAIENYSAANNAIANLDPQDQDNIKSAANQGVKATEAVAVVNNGDTDFAPPTSVNGSIFRATDGAVYSDENPIPVDKGATSGLVYKVQVGAFRKPLPQDYFSQFAPISGEKIRDGITLPLYI